MSFQGDTIIGRAWHVEIEIGMQLDQQSPTKEPNLGGKQDMLTRSIKAVSKEGKRGGAKPDHTRGCGLLPLPDMA